MRSVDVPEAAEQLCALVDAVLAGEEVVITREGEPAARLVPLVPATERPKRRLGILAGVAVFPDGFDAPLPDDMLGAFEGKVA